MTMRIPLSYYTEFKVWTEDDGTVVIRVRRAFGFAIEFVLMDSPLMVDKFLTAFETGFKKTGIIGRMRKAMGQEPLAPTPPPAKSNKPPLVASKGFERRKPRSTGAKK